MSEEQITLNELADEVSTSSAGWHQIKMENLAEFQNGNAFSKSDWTDSGYPIIRIQNLTGEREEYNYFNGELEHRYRVENDDLLLSWSATIDVFEWEGPEAALNQHIYRVDTENQVNEKFFRFKLEELLPRLEALSHGSTMQHVRKTDLINLNVEIPPIKEQRKIASVLYTVDQAIQMTEEAIKQTFRVKHGLMQNLFREGIDSPEIKDLRRIGQVPKHWDVVKLGDVSTKITDGTHKSPPTIENGFPYITSQNVRNWGFDLSDLKYISEEDHERITSRTNPELGDVLYVKDGANTGNVNVNTLDFEFSLLSSVALIKPNRSKIKPWFLKYLFSWPKFRELVLSQMSGTGIRRLTISKLEKTDVLVPPMEEQEQIVDILNEYYEYRENQQVTLDKLKRLKKGLMQDLLSGEVRTTDADIEVLDAVTQHG